MKERRAYMDKKKKMTSFGVLKKYRAKVIIAPILKGVEVVCELVVPFIVSSIIDLPFACVNNVVIGCCKSVGNPGKASVFI